ncbi:hypothetical protein H0H92_015312 [Tricholoma furcatifolium]|nr:hypothetical protein H0H92_015312 [Tricholoma furcatifolium]
MTTNLYEALGVPANATPEQIRKAYKKRALQTHPDRLPPGTSPEEKATSEELFRKLHVKLYDQHGVWPPPEAPMPQNQSGFSSHTQYPTFNSRDGFFQNSWGHHPSFNFTDPFTLFDAIFDAHGFPTPRRHRHHYERPWFASQLSRMTNDDSDSRFHQNFGGFMNFPFPFGSNMMSIPPPPPFFGAGNGGQWQSESYSSTTINGVTTTSHRRRDWTGNEQVTHTYADGRNVHSVNGVQQSQPQITEPPRQIPAAEHHSSSAPPPYQGHNHGHRSSHTRAFNSVMFSPLLLTGVATGAMIEDRPHRPRYQRWHPDPDARPGDHFASPRYDPIQLEIPREKRERH